MSAGAGDSFHELALGSYIEDALRSEGAPIDVAEFPSSFDVNSPELRATKDFKSQRLAPL